MSIRMGKTIAIRLNRFILLLGLIASQLFSVLMVEGGSFISETFETYSTNFWTPQGFSVDGGCGVLTVAGTNLHQGATLRFNTPLNMPTEEEAFLSFSMEVGAMKAFGEKEFATSARIFIAPQPLPDFLEPYTLENALSVIIQRSNDGLYTLSLYQKDGGKDGFGLRLLETMPFPDSELPLTFDLWVNTSAYRIKFNKPIETSRGARSGYISFSEGWKNNLTLALRVVNESTGARSQLVFDNVTVQEKVID